MWITDFFDLFFGRCLSSWNKKINLTSRTDKDDVILKHFIDSAMMIRYHDLNDQKRLDIGSGWKDLVTTDEWIKEEYR